MQSEQLYLRQSVLNPDQYHCNFQQIDHDTTRLLNSDEARKVTGQMFGIYGMLKIIPFDYWKAPNQLRIFGNGELGAWELLCKFTNTASATLRKALKWMDEQGVIKYWAGRNGAGIGIYFNLAINSVRRRATQKNLRLVPASSDDLPTSAPEVPLYEENHVFFRDIQDSDKRADAPADEPPPATAQNKLHLVPRTAQSDEIYQRLSALESNAAQLQQGIQRLIALAPDPAWLEKSALPKAVRVAVAEAMKIVERERQAMRNAYVGAHQPPQSSQPDVALPPPRKIEHNPFYAGKLALIERCVKAESKRTWFDPLQVEKTRDGVRIVAPDPVFREWIENNYAGILSDVGLTNCEWEFTERNSQ